jgi:hypothetical protein
MKPYLIPPPEVLLEDDLRILLWKPNVILRTFQSLTLLKKKTPLKTYFKINE